MENDLDLQLGVALGAEADVSAQCFTIYIPNKDRAGVEFGNQRKWVLEAMNLLCAINGGATAMPPAEGAWLASEGRAVWENPVLVYSYVRPALFVQFLVRIREFLHRMGRETNQGEVVVELDGQFYRIRTFDEPKEHQQ